MRFLRLEVHDLIIVGRNVHFDVLLDRVRNHLHQTPVDVVVPLYAVVQFSDRDAMPLNIVLAHVHQHLLPYFLRLELGEVLLK